MPKKPKKDTRIFKRTYNQMLKDMERTCARCGKAFYPLDQGRDICIGCYNQKRADAEFQRMAFGAEWR